MSKKQLLTLACLLVVAVGGATGFAQSAPKGDGGQDESPRRATTQVWTLAGGNFLGVQTEEVTRENMGRFGVSGEPRGVGVGQVFEGGPAAKVGLQKGDVIVRFDGEAVTSAAKLQRLVSEAAPEQSVRLAILRGGAEREIVIKLGRHEGSLERFRLPDGHVFRWEDHDALKRQSEEWKKQGDEWRKQGEGWKLNGEELRRQLQNLPRLDNLPHGNFAFAFASGRRIGVATMPVTEQLADHFGVSERRGLLVSFVADDGPAAKAGLKAGDVITEADGEKIGDVSDLSRVIGRKETGDVTLAIVRDRARRTVRVTPEKRERPEGFVVPRAELRGARSFVLPSTSRVVTPRVIAPRVIAPARVRTIMM